VKGDDSSLTGVPRAIPTTGKRIAGRPVGFGDIPRATRIRARERPESIGNVETRDRSSDPARKARHTNRFCVGFAIVTGEVPSRLGEFVERRTVLKSAAAVAGASLTALALPGSASAAVYDYDVLVTEQNRNKVMLFQAANAWNPTNEVWSWAAPTVMVEGKNTWRLLTDARFRDTNAFGWVALVASSGGKVGIVNVGDDDALLWSATPYGNPHAVERIPSRGVIVVASSQASSAYDTPGYLTVYGATDPDDPTTLAVVQRISFQGAHGLWYDGEFLWVLGDWTLAKCRIEGELRNARVVAEWTHSFPSVFYGHSLDMDFSNTNSLLMSGGGAIHSVNKTTGVITRNTPTGTGIKSYSRTYPGESFWVKARDVGTDSPWSSGFVQFFDAAGAPSYQRALSGYGYDAEFYRARVSSVRYV